MNHINTVAQNCTQCENLIPVGAEAQRNAEGKLLCSDKCAQDYSSPEAAAARAAAAPPEPVPAPATGNVKAAVVESKDALAGTRGGVFAADGAVFVSCPSCGNIYGMPSDVFTYDAKTVSIGPASIKMNSCGWHGYLTNGEWLPAGDSTCQPKPVAAPVPEAATET